MSSDASWVADMPSVYDRGLGPALFEPFAPALAGLVAAGRPARVLELAAGSGILTAALVAALPAAQLTATDLNPAMVGYASSRVSGPSWAQADAQQLAYADGSFDAVVSQFGVMFFPDKPAAFAETARVLTPEGRTIFAVWDVVEATRLSAAMVESLAAVFPVDTPSFIARVPHGYHDQQRIRDDLTAGGLVTESIERVVKRGTAADARLLTQGFCLGSPLLFELQERGELTELTAALVREMTQRLGEGPLEGDATALFVNARKG